MSYQKWSQEPFDSSSDLTAFPLFKYLWNVLKRKFLIFIFSNEKKLQLGRTSLLYRSYFQYLFLLFLSENTLGFKYKICILVLIIHSDTAVVQNSEQSIFPKITATVPLIQREFNCCLIRSSCNLKYYFEVYCNSELLIEFSCILKTLY